MIGCIALLFIHYVFFILFFLYNPFGSEETLPTTSVKMLKVFKKPAHIHQNLQIWSHKRKNQTFGVVVEEGNEKSVGSVTLNFTELYCIVRVCLFPCVIILLLCLQISVCLSHFGWHYPLWSVSWPLSLLCSCFVFVELRFLFLSFWESFSSCCFFFSIPLSFVLPFLLWWWRCLVYLHLPRLVVFVVIDFRTIFLLPAEETQTSCLVQKFLTHFSFVDSRHSTKYFKTGIHMVPVNRLSLRLDVWLSSSADHDVDNVCVYVCVSACLGVFFSAC